MIRSQISLKSFRTMDIDANYVARVYTPCPYSSTGTNCPNSRMGTSILESLEVVISSPANENKIKKNQPYAKTQT